MKKDNIPKERKPKHRKICQHTNTRGVVGVDNEILWYECVNCKFDFPLVTGTK